MEIRVIQADDVPAVSEFFASISDDEKCFIKENELDGTLAKAWAQDTQNTHLLTFVEDRVVASVNIVPGIGISSHIAELRLIVDPTERGSGVGKALAREALIYAVASLELKKVFVEVVADQDTTVGMFQKMGFVPEALLQDHLCDRQGNLRDLVILSHFVQENWERMKALGLDGEFSV